MMILPFRERLGRSWKKKVLMLKLSASYEDCLKKRIEEKKL